MKGWAQLSAGVFAAYTMSRAVQFLKSFLFRITNARWFV